MLNSKINKQDYQNFINNINYGYSLISKKNFKIVFIVETSSMLSWEVWKTS